MKFEDLKLSKQLLESIKDSGIDSPTEIQEKTIPHAIEGKDIIGESATGSGKTLAFGCGIVENLEAKRGLQALVLTPTRELAEQVKEVLKYLGNKKNLKVISVYGGVSINPQIKDLKFADVVVATPGRFLDHLNRRTINTSKIKLLVLDEADRMFDMGFRDDVEKIIRSCPKERQTLLFSATISSDIARLANNHLINPVRIRAGKFVDPSKLKQVYYDVDKNIKLSLFYHLLMEETSGLVMAFCNTRRSTDFVVKSLRANKVNTVGVHGGLTQNKRSSIMKKFNDGKTHVLVCTDVAARGLDIDNVSHVYNYEIPKDSTDYIHRIGRTARAGKDGKVINLLCDYDHDNFSRVLRDNRSFVIEKIITPKIKRIAAARIERKPDFHRRGRNGFRNKRIRYNNR
ncbi:MAG: ATP-dependent RNA helicase [Nanoarchaeota archaeon]|nr:ATP-dependent RNA helicase [Nanoarchaeota archaeon]